jgi:hypothetical protein
VRDKILAHLVRQHVPVIEVGKKRRDNGIEHELGGEQGLAFEFSHTMFLFYILLFFLILVGQPLRGFPWPFK